MANHSRKARSTKKQVRDYKRRMKKAFGPEECARFTISASATGLGVHIRWKDDESEQALPASNHQASPTPIVAPETSIYHDAPIGPEVEHQERSLTRLPSSSIEGVLSRFTILKALQDSHWRAHMGLNSEDDESDPGYSDAYVSSGVESYDEVSSDEDVLERVDSIRLRSPNPLPHWI